MFRQDKKIKGIVPRWSVAENSYTSIYIWILQALQEFKDSAILYAVDALIQRRKLFSLENSILWLISQVDLQAWTFLCNYE